MRRIALAIPIGVEPVAHELLVEACLLTTHFVIVGANLVKRVPERALRFAFALFLLLMAVLLVVNEASVI